MDFSPDKVTPLSKALAMMLFVALPFIGFWMGYNFGSKNSSSAGDRDLCETSPVNEKGIDLGLSSDQMEGLRFTIPQTDTSFIVPETYSVPTFEPVHPNQNPKPVLQYESTSENHSSVMRIQVFELTPDFRVDTPAGHYLYNGGSWDDSQREVNLLGDTNILRYSMGDAGGYAHVVAIPQENQMIIIMFSGDTNEPNHVIFEEADKVFDTIEIQ